MNFSCTLNGGRCGILERLQSDQKTLKIRDVRLNLQAIFAAFCSRSEFYFFTDLSDVRDVLL